MFGVKTCGKRLRWPCGCGLVISMSSLDSNIF